MTIQQHSRVARQSSNSKINVAQLEVLKATSIDIAGSIFIASSKNQSVSPLLLVLVPVTYHLNKHADMHILKRHTYSESICIIKVSYCCYCDRLFRSVDRSNKQPIINQSAQ